VKLPPPHLTSVVEMHNIVTLSNEQNSGKYIHDRQLLSSIADIFGVSKVFFYMKSREKTKKFSSNGFRIQTFHIYE